MRNGTSRGGRRFTVEAAPFAWGQATVLDVFRPAFCNEPQEQTARMRWPFSAKFPRRARPVSFADVRQRTLGDSDGPRILVLTPFLPLNHAKSVFGIFQRLRRHLLALDALGPVHVALFSPDHAPVPLAAKFAISRNAHQLWPLRGTLDFVAASGSKRWFDRVTDLFWSLRGIVGFINGRPTMHTCRWEQVGSLERILGALQPDLIFAHGLSAAVPLLRIKSRLPPIVVAFDDVESVQLERSVGSKRHSMARWRVLLRVWMARQAERRVTAMATAVLVCSELERQKVRAMCRTDRVFAIPNTATAFGELAAASRPVAVFVGTARYGPNREAFVWFAREIWPRVRAAVPEARVLVVGDKTDELGIASAPLGIETLGFVENLGPIYADAMIAVCPIRRGSGTRIKVIEAAINCRPVVSTTLGAEGLIFEPGAEILFADDAEAFAAACIRLFRDPRLAARIGQAARARALSAYMEDSAVELLRNVCGEALKSARRAAFDPAEASGAACGEIGRKPAHWS